MTDEHSVDAADDRPTARADRPTEVAHTADARGLAVGLAELAGLVTSSWPLRELLTKVAVSAVKAIPGADGAGVTLLRVDQPHNRVEALAASAPFVSEIDRLQYEELDEGPCITAALERRTVRSGSLDADMLWPEFGPRVGRMGVHSVLSLPLLLPGQVVGAINVYAHGTNVFDENAAAVGELFAESAAVAVHNAQILAQAQALAGSLQTALTARPIIDQAIGILRARGGVTEQEAFDRLRSTGRTDQVELSVVAQRVVDEAIRRARSRRSGDDHDPKTW